MRCERLTGVNRRQLALSFAASAVLLTGCPVEPDDGTPAAPTGDPVVDAATTTSASSDESQLAAAVAPDWYAQRSRLDSCGLDAESSPSYPNLAVRACFRQAFGAGTPAELTVVTYGDEGESRRAHYRVLGPASYEVLAESVPSSATASAPGVGGSDAGWHRWRCDRFVFIDEPGNEIDGAPILNAEGECEQVDGADG